MEDLEQDDGRDGGALVHGGVDVPQGCGQVEAVLSTSYADFPSELERRKFLKILTSQIISRCRGQIYEFILLNNISPADLY